MDSTVTVHMTVVSGYNKVCLLKNTGIFCCINYSAQHIITLIKSLSDERRKYSGFVLETIHISPVHNKNIRLVIADKIHAYVGQKIAAPGLFSSYSELQMWRNYCIEEIRRSTGAYVCIAEACASLPVSGQHSSMRKSTFG